jgi:hypothetical protein
LVSRELRIGLIASGEVQVLEVQVLEVQALEASREVVERNALVEFVFVYLHLFAYCLSSCGAARVIFQQ